jgi:hypothetical protein
VRRIPNCCKKVPRFEFLSEFKNEKVRLKSGIWKMFLSS